jgi:hypothetical protein
MLTSQVLVPPWRQKVDFFFSFFVPPLFFHTGAISAVAVRMLTCGPHTVLCLHTYCEFMISTVLSESTSLRNETAKVDFV